MVEYGMTSNVVCETDASAGRAMATRRGVGLVRHLDTRLLWLQQLCAEGVVEVRARPCIDLEREEHVRDTSGWFWICVGMVIAVLTVLSSGPFANPISDDCSRQKETDENAAW